MLRRQPPAHSNPTYQFAAAESRLAGPAPERQTSGRTNTCCIQVDRRSWRRRRRWPPFVASPRAESFRFERAAARAKSGRQLKISSFRPQKAPAHLLPRGETGCDARASARRRPGEIISIAPNQRPASRSGGDKRSTKPPSRRQQVSMAPTNQLPSLGGRPAQQVSSRLWSSIKWPACGWAGRKRTANRKRKESIPRAGSVGRAGTISSPERPLLALRRPNRTIDSIWAPAKVGREQTHLLLLEAGQPASEQVVVSGRIKSSRLKSGRSLIGAKLEAAGASRLRRPERQQVAVRQQVRRPNRPELHRPLEAHSKLVSITTCRSYATNPRRSFHGHLSAIKLARLSGRRGSLLWPLLPPPLFCPPRVADPNLAGDCYAHQALVARSGPRPRREMALGEQLGPIKQVAPATLRRLVARQMQTSFDLALSRLDDAHLEDASPPATTCRPSST